MNTIAATGTPTTGGATTTTGAISAVSCVFNVGVVGGQFAAHPKTDEKIRSFGKLPEGWHYGQGRPPSAEIITIARAYLGHFMMLGYTETDAFPGVDGEIMVKAYRGKHSVEVTVELDRSFVVTHRLGGKDEYHESDLSGIQACLALGAITSRIAQEECDIFAWFIPNFMTVGRGNLQTWHSRHLARQVAPRSSWNSVGRTPVDQFALTLTGFTATSVGTLQFSGGSMIQNLIASYAR